jgi:hypothetical protein
VVFQSSILCVLFSEKALAVYTIRAFWIVNYLISLTCIIGFLY